MSEKANGKGNRGGGVLEGLDEKGDVLRGTTKDDFLFFI